MFEYRSCQGKRRIILPDTVIKHLWKHRQRSLLSRERGGQLFAEFGDDSITVRRASGPRSADKKRGRWHFRPNKETERSEIERQFARGLHFIGDWHTHPQNVPKPSPRDLLSMSDSFLRSRHDLDAFMLIIVGRSAFPEGLWVGLHVGEAHIRLCPETIG